MTSTITAVAEPTATPPRVRLNITSDRSSILVDRVAGDGTRTPVRTYTGAALPVSGGSALLYDPEVPYGPAVTYVVTGDEGSPSNAVSVTPTVVWLTHPGVPELSRALEVVSVGPRQRPARQAIRYPIGSRFPIVADDGRRKAPTYDLTIRTRTLTALDAIEKLTDDLGALLLNVPTTKGWGINSEYVKVGDLEEQRVTRFGSQPFREWRLPCIVVPRPTGGQQAANNYRRSYSRYPTYNARYAAHSTYRAAFAEP